MNRLRALLAAAQAGIVRHPWRILLASTVCFMLAAAGGAKLRFTSDYRVYFDGENPDLVALEAFEDKFEQKETLIFAIEPADGDVFTPYTLAALKVIADEAWTLPYALRVSALANHQHSYAQGDELIVEALVPDGPVSEAEAQRIRDIALSSSELVDSLVAADGSVAAMTVTTPLPHADPESEVPEVANAVRAFIADMQERFPHLKFYVSGVTMLNDAMGQTMRSDLSTLFPAMGLMIFLGLVLYFRSFWPAFMAQVVITVSSLAAYGIAGWAGIVLNTASLASGLIIMTLAVADSIHVLVTWRHALSQGMDKAAAMRESLRVNLQPVFLTSVTTAIGFLSLNFSDSPPFRDMGNIVTIGVGIAFLASILTLPAMAVLLPASAGWAERKRPWADRLGGFVVRHRNRLLPVMALVILGLGAGLPLNRLGDDYAKYFAESVQFRTDTDFINDRVAGMQSLQYELHAQEPGGVNDPEFLRRIEAFSNWFEQQPDVRKVHDITALYKRLNKSMHGDDDAWHRLPDSRELAAQYLLFYELSLPAGLGLNTLIDPDQQSTRFLVMLNTIDSGRLRALDEAAVDWLQARQPDWFWQQQGGVGTSLIFARITQRNFDAMVDGLIMAVVLISLLMVLLMRSVKIGLLSMVPNLVPAVMGFGAWGYLVGQIGISLTVVGPMTLGIVVDDTVHFLSKYLRARREQHQDTEQAIRYAFHTVGTALTLTTVVLALGFLILSQSVYQMTSHMGYLTAATIVLALIADFLFLPPLLMLVDRARRRA